MTIKQLSFWLCLVSAGACSPVLVAQTIPTEVDVVVVGAGGAGLSAATTLAQGGESVVVLEKMPSIGGNTLRAGGFFNAVDPEHEPLSDTKDSEERYFEQMMASGGGENSPEVVRALAHYAYPTMKWLESLGMQFHETTVAVWGAEWPRGHKSKESRGQGYIRVLSGELLKRGGQIFTNQTVVGLMTNSQGRVTGVETTSTREKKQPTTIRAREAVVLAAGGFSPNTMMINEYAPQWANLTTDNNPGNTGDLLPLAQGVGAQLVGLNNVQVVPGRPMGQTFQVRLDLDISRSILVDGEGKHVIDEDAPRNQLAKAVMEREESGVYTLTDQATVNTFDAVSKRDVYRGLETGAALRAMTLSELARRMKMNEEELKRAVDEFNRSVKEKTGKCARLPCHPIEVPPFWAAPVVMSIHSTLGGVKINEFGEVLDKQNLPIPGLFAAGEVTGNVHGENRLGGNGIADAITFGRIAGTRILSLTPKTLDSQRVSTDISQ